MKVHELIKFNQGLIKNLIDYGIRLKDASYIELFFDYERMQKSGEKVTYIVALLSTKYSISERKVYKLLKWFKSDCKIWAAEIDRK